MRTQHPLLNPKKASCSKILILNRRSMSKQSIFMRFCACLKGTDKFVPVCQKSQRVKKVRSRSTSFCFVWVDDSVRPAECS